MPTLERVLVIPADHFRAVGYFHGFRPADDGYHAALLDQRMFSFRPRAEVETDPAFKQLIPYIVLRHGDRLFHYRRGKAGTEKRLEALRSVGIGGHISEADAAGDGDPYRNGMARELTEEVDIAGGFADRLLGFINDDRTFVGSVQLGVVHLFELTAADVTAKEDALADGGFAPAADLWAARGQFETWSQFVLDRLVTSSPPEPGRSPG
jgi:predicted NUDIX family phosphoesterase